MAPPKLKVPDPTHREIIDELKKRACGLLPVKREAVRCVVEHKQTIVQEMNRVDSASAERMDNAIPTMAEFTKSANNNAGYVAHIIFEAASAFLAFNGVKTRL